MTNGNYTQLSISIDKLGTHLFKVTNHHSGEVTLKWDWDALLQEVQIATGDRKVHYVDVGTLSPNEAVALVKETEAKVKKTRAKRVDPSPETLSQWNAELAKAEKIATKRPAAKKPAAKKAVTKKSK